MEEEKGEWDMDHEKPKKIATLTKKKGTNLNMRFEIFGTPKCVVFCRKY